MLWPFVFAPIMVIMPKIPRVTGVDACLFVGGAVLEAAPAAGEAGIDGGLVFGP